MNHKPLHVVWHHSEISREDRQALHGHRSFVLWLTGLSGSGKSTVAYELEKWFYSHGFRSYVLDGDNIRQGLNRDLGFSPDDRKENVRRIGEVARILVDAGLIAIVALISPYRSDREKIRGSFRPGEFVEVYVQCGLEECERRDPKGLYNRARAGIIKEFTGISAPYEPPLDPEITINTEKYSVLESVQYILNHLITNRYIRIPSS